ncbi:Ubiquitin-conjugating enzyme [seawater metagenome]|uniref:Ubiquitin-conjugating enzyme n=1 Tax=seawater metagenome TaxID=1561972 RepID=A0A5E8CLB3_9ZZZZ
MNSAQLRLSKEYESFLKDCIEGISVNLKEDNLFFWEAIIIGPYDSPWENGIFKLNLEFNTEYPLKPPKIKFLSKMFHPNIYTSGSICLDILQNKWTPVQDIKSVLISIQSLLTDPNIDSPANMQAADLYKNDRKQYNKKVRKYAEESISV